MVQYIDDQSYSFDIIDQILKPIFFHYPLEHAWVHQTCI